MTTCRLVLLTTIVGVLAVVPLPDMVSALEPQDIKPNSTYGKPCLSAADCDTALDQFCDILIGVCLCIPNTAYDRAGEACRSTRCESKYDYRLQAYTYTECPDGSHCYESRCTRFCPTDDYTRQCHTKPDIRHIEDITYLLLTYAVAGLIAVFYAVILLTCLYRRCKRFRCKLVSTQHGKCILIASSKKPLKGNETPASIYSLCYCAPPVATATPHIPHPGQTESPPPVVAQPLLEAATTD